MGHAGNERGHRVPVVRLGLIYISVKLARALPVGYTMDLAGIHQVTWMVLDALTTDG